MNILSDIDLAKELKKQNKKTVEYNSKDYSYNHYHNKNNFKELGI